jgi:ribonuclease-3
MYQKLEKTIKIYFQDKSLLRNAFTHRSYLNEHPEEKLVSNERLEFLGDAVLEFLVSFFLYQKFLNSPEGELTSLRSKLVCTRSLAIIAKKLEFGQYLFLSRGEEESGGRTNSTLLANTFEAVLGAIYLDQGLEQVKKFLERHLFPSLKEVKKFRDYKSEFQEKAQENFKITPVYETVRASGPDHNRIFTVAVYLDKKLWGRGVGKSKQEAEQEAAKKALKQIT